MRTPNLKLIAAAIAASVSALTAVPALAEAPAGPPPFAARAAQGGPGIEGALQFARAKLNLTADQSAALDAILAGAKSQAKAAREASKSTVEQMKAELAKPQPNLRTLAQLQESLAPQREAIRKSVQSQLLSFYDTLNASQQATVVEGLRKMAAFRERRVARWTN
ncbi:MAG: Spy/CpxP family protein refolding chaperone [Betaproteobacteria bacterium]|nr:Spy/CpxP family protein refolding chaperone [Betaproteobacteria bacterium]